MPTRPTTTLKLDPELKERVRKLAAIRKRSPHWVMQEAITQFVGREEQRETFLAEARAAWADYQATGLHLSAEETDRWLASWGTEDETPAPECHD